MLGLLSLLGLLLKYHIGCRLTLEQIVAIQGVDLLLLLKDQILLLLDVVGVHLRDIWLLALGLTHRILWVQRIIW